MNADQFVEVAYGGRGEGNPGDANRAAAAAARARYIDGLPEETANRIWDECVNKTRNYKGVANQAMAKKLYAKEVERARAKHEANVKKRQAARERKAQAVVAAQKAAPATKPVTEAEALDALMVAAEDDPVYEIPDNWDDEAGLESINGPAGAVSANVRGVVMEQSQDITYSTPPGHRILATSRSVMAYQLRREGIEKMAARDTGRNRPVVFEVGAGSGGVKAAVQLKLKYASAASTYMHCTFPVAGADDLARDVLLLGRSMFAHDIADHVNWVDRTGYVSQEKVNVCSHLARDCDCLRHYGPSYVYALHSAYYFTDSDWDALFRMTDDVHVGVHLPERDGQNVPADAPEFRWQYLDSIRDICTHFGLVRGISVAAEKALLGHNHVAFQPLAAHGTTYAHRNIADDIRRGGFHIVRYSRIADRVVENPLACAAIGLGLAVATTQVPRIVGKLLRGKMPWAEMATLAAAASPAWAMSAVAAARNSRVPTAAAQYTVKVIPGWDYVRHGETVCAVYQYRRTPLAPLEARIIETKRPVLAKAREMAATMALSNNPDKASRAVVAMGLRSGLSPVEVKDTVDAAREYCSLILAPKNGLATEVRPWPLGNDPVSSVLDWDPLTVAMRLGQVLMAGGLTKELLSTLPPEMTGWMPLEEYQRKFSTPATQNQLCGVSPLPSSSTSLNLTASVPADLVQNFGAWLSQRASLLRTVPSWLSTLSQNATSRPPLMLWGPPRSL